jgi:hypothetical protein
MKFKQKLVDDIISTDEEYAFLESMQDGFYRYLIRFFVNPQKALLYNNSTIDIIVSKETNIETNIPIFNTQTPSFAEPSKTPFSSEKITSDLLKKNSVIKDVIRASAENDIIKVKSDFTARFSNELSQQFAKKDLTNPIQVKLVRNFVSVPIKSAEKQNINLPILESSIAPTANPSQIDEGNIKKLANELLYEKGIDPASIFLKQNAIIGAKKNFEGVAHVKSNINIDKRYELILSSINKGNIEKPTINSISPIATITLPRLTGVTNVIMEEYIDIPYGSIQKGEFYIVFILRDASGIPVQKLSKIVPHANNIAALKVPKKPPIIRHIKNGKFGKNTLEIQQVDENGIGINLYRKICNTSKNNIDSEYTFVGKIPLTVLDGPKLVDDFVSNASQIIYRAIPYGEDDRNGFEFSTTVAAPVKIPSRLVNGNKRKSYAGLIYEITNAGIIIKIIDIPSGPTSVILLKEDLTSKKGFQFVDKPRLLTGKGSDAIVFNDSNVSKGKIYRYFYKFVYKDGSELFGSNSITIEYLPETKNIVKTQIINPKVVEKGTDFDVEFTLESYFINTSEEELKKTLFQQGLGDFFSTKLNIEDLQNLIAYGIVRNNLTTGEIENFGIVVDKKFSDLEHGKVNGVKPVKIGNEYEYSVTTFFRSPISMLKEYTKTVEFPENPQKNYSYKPYIWLHPITLTQGNIISDRSLKRNHAKTQFSFGEIGNITKTTLSLANILPNIYDASATKMNSRLIKIQWKLQGNATKIDHFIVILNILGMKTVVGKAHNITDSNYFEFYDTLTDNEKGSLSYTIIPVYYDYSRGKEISTNKVLI